MLEKKDGLFCFFIEHNNTWQDKATGLKCNKKICVCEQKVDNFVTGDLWEN